MLPLKDTIPARDWPWVTWALIGLNLGVFAWLTFMRTPTQAQQVMLHYGLVPAYLRAAEPRAWLSVFTSMFLHGSWLHVLTNTWALAIFGDNVEDRMGHARYLVFYVVCGLGAGLAQVSTDTRSYLPIIGASGALAGVLAAYWLFFPQARILTLLPFAIWEVPAFIFLAGWLFTQLLSGVMVFNGLVQQDGVAYWAHLGGFGVGWLLARVFARRSRVGAFTRPFSPRG